MAFNLLFHDSFDHYATAQILLKYGANSPGGEISAAHPRTGTQCCALGSLGGPTTKSLGEQTNLVTGHALYPGTLGGAIMIWEAQAISDFCCFAEINGDGSISVYNNTPTQVGPLLLTTPPNLVQVGVYCYIEYAIIFNHTTGAVYVRVNGVLVASATGVSTTHSVTQNWCDGVSLSGPPSILAATHYHDDFYIGYDDTGNPQNAFQGAVRLYPYIPGANESPVNWTPLSGQNWQETSQIPPPGDSAYVSSGAVGTVDQYQLVPISGEGPTGTFTIPFGQVVMDAKLDSAGSGSVAADIGGHVGTAHPLSTSYNMFTDPYTVNPVTGLPFTASDFATTFMGPKQTA